VPRHSFAKAPRQPTGLTPPEAYPQQPSPRRFGPAFQPAERSSIALLQHYPVDVRVGLPLKTRQFCRYRIDAWKQAGKVICPASFVITVVTTPVALLVALISTPGNTALVASLTVPLTVAFADCPNAEQTEDTTSTPKQEVYA
jgi:hypothetical protein